MCNACIHTNQLTNNTRESYDPTRTTVLRNMFAADMKRRFTAIRRLIQQAVVEQDVFGLQRSTHTLQANELPGERAFAFTRDSQKIQAFIQWLNRQVNSGILEIVNRASTEGAETAWTNIYIKDSYKRGIMRAQYEMRQIGVEVPNIQQTGGIDYRIQQPFHANRLGLLYTRTFQDLKGITNVLDTQISRILTQGIADGDNPRLLARKMNAVIRGIGEDLGIRDTLGRFIPAERRAEILARTEIIRAHHSAMMQEYRQYELHGLHIKAEHTTAGDRRVCNICQDLEGKEYTLDQAENMIPVHPQCRCIALPKSV